MHQPVPEFSDTSIVGRGGTSVVLKGTSESGQQVAIKVLTGIWEPVRARRFAREIEAMQLLDGVRGVVPILDSGTTEKGSPFLVMPYYEKGSLNDHLKNHGPIPWEQATTIITQLAETLTQTHNHNIYHRDLKPANILQDNNDQYWLTDFGITEIADGRSLSTTAAYTPGYCPPETLTQGRKNTNGATVDTYGLTATLWALIAGHTPFTNPQEPDLDPIVLLNNVATKPIGPPNNQTPNWLNRIIEKGTAKNPEHRYQNIPTLLHDLQNQHTPEPTTQKRTTEPTIHRPHPNNNTPKTNTTQTTKTTKRKPLIAAAITATLLLVTAATIIALNQNREPTQTADNTNQSQSTGVSGQSVDTAESATGDTSEAPSSVTANPDIDTKLPGSDQTTAPNASMPAPQETSPPAPAPSISLSKGSPELQGGEMVVDYVVSIQNIDGSVVGTISCMALDASGNPAVVAAFSPTSISKTPTNVGCTVRTDEPPTQRWVQFSGPGIGDLVSNRVTW